MIPHVISGNTISVFIGGDLKTLDSSHPYFDEIKHRLRTGNDDLLELLDMKTALKKVLYEDDAITVGYDTLLYKGTPVHNYLATKIIDFVRTNQQATPWINFLKRLQQNPDPEIKDHLFDWLEAGGMPITPDGFFLAYKKVRDDYLSYHDGATRNDVGSTVFLPREECDTDRFRTCSSGLHFCAWDYLPNYYGSEGRVLVLKICPSAVVAFPPDHKAKGRAYWYTIVDEVPEEEAKHAFPKPVYTTAFDDDGLDGFYDGYGMSDDPPLVGVFGRLKAWTKKLLH